MPGASLLLKPNTSWLPGPTAAAALFACHTTPTPPSELGEPAGVQAEAAIVHVRQHADELSWRRAVEAGPERNHCRFAQDRPAHHGASDHGSTDHLGADDRRQELAARDRQSCLAGVARQ